MKFDLVQAPAVTVEAAQFRNMTIGEPPVFLIFLRPHFGPQICQPLVQPAARFTLHGLAHRRVHQVDVAPCELIGLVGDLMGFEDFGRCVGCHGVSPR